MTDVTYVEQRLAALAELHSIEITDYNTMKEVLIQELEIYRELLPSYKIKVGGTTQANIPVQHGRSKKGGKKVEQLSLRKKEAMKVELCEQTLLQHYQAYLQMLLRFCAKKHPESQALGSRCIADLCSFAKYYNHNEILIRAVVEAANAKLAAVAQPCLNALKELFASGEVDEPCLLAVDSVLRLVRERHHALNPKILYTFLQLRIRAVDIHREDPVRAKKERHYKKEEKRVASKLQNTEHAQATGTLRAVQTRVLQKIMTVYLRVLDSSQRCSELHQSLLLAPTLEGLTKFAHLMNLDLHVLLLKSLRELVEDTRTSTTVGLHALIAVASLSEHTTQTEGVAKADLHQFHDALYRYVQDSLKLPAPSKTRVVALDGAEEGAEPEEEEAIEKSGGEDEVRSKHGSSAAFSIAKSMAERRFVSPSAAIEWTHRAKLCLVACEELLVKLKRLPAPRVAAFVRVLSLYSTAVPSHISLALVRLIQKLMTLNPTVTGLVLGGPDHVVGSGEFNLESHSADHANATTSFLWEVHALKQSYHPTVRTMVGKMQKEYVRARKRYELLAQVPSSLETLNPVQVLLKFDTSKGGFHPLPVAPRTTKTKRAEGNDTDSNAAGPAKKKQRQA